MSNVFTQFLSGFADGIFGDKGYLKDYKHAARLYQDNYYGMAPKAGWSYFIELGLSPYLWDKTTFQSIDNTWYNRSKGKLGLLAKSADQPRFSIATETLNQYNKKTVVQNKITYNPVSITFHDDMDNIITDLWKNYYQYYFADSRYTGFSQLSNQTSSLPAAFKQNVQYDGRAYAYGLNNGQTLPFFNYIKIFLLNRRKYTSVTLVNPIITEWAPAQLDQTSGNRLLDAKMTFAYEAVYYDTQNKPVSRTEPGFNANHYDNTPSPLRAAGGGTRGLGGLISGADEVLGVFNKEGPLSVGDIITAAVGTRNVIRNARSITSAGVKQELYSVANSVFVNAALGNNATGAVISDVVRSPINVNLSIPVSNVDLTTGLVTETRVPLGTFARGVVNQLTGPRVSLETPAVPRQVGVGDTPATSTAPELQPNTPSGPGR
jgi:hypothetical protein